MVGLVETIWLFVRDGESVRMIRASTPEGGLRLIVYGPGNAQAVHEFRDSMSCSAHQSEIERQLVATGFGLEQFTDRRSGLERRGDARGSDRRRES